ncbi:glycosyltransferase [Deinococcus cellulosilyticus]|uniref:Glycosyl transferase n=1 Tax=Deinococcus cellulosilyticus (strain DSM 18568 / NBRC 106333 / KACC 11606 / 5516J-15) TaxID=1223518 RepID=A0A511N407_DEIC1|nr:glycosyltransferase [Deinococcus cellulosilyticus]GEM47593.1 glycosyl transferase [Deinococcus cellulosilyticus NBRC 106333 = KACC 11606]
MKKVVMLIPDLSGGGAERIFINLANEIANNHKNYKVWVIVFEAGDDSYKDLIKNTVQIINLNTRSRFAVFPLFAKLREIKPDYVLATRTLANLLAVVVGLMLKIIGQRTKIVLREANTLSVYGNASAGAKAKIVDKLVGILYPRADSLIAVSEGVRLDLEQNFHVKKHKIKTINNPLLDHIEDLEAIAPIKVDKPYILGVGRFAPQKDFNTLIMAFSEVRKHRDCKLVLLGKGALKDEYLQLAESLGCKQDIEMPGFVSNPIPYFRGAEVFVLSSKWEGLPGVLIQALAYGSKVVSTDCPSGPREILEDGRLGGLVPIGSPQLLADQILESMSKEPPVLKERFAYMYDKYGIGPNTKRYLEVLND